MREQLFDFRFDFKVVGEQFRQILTVIVIILMDVVQEEDQPVTEVYPACLATASRE